MKKGVVVEKHRKFLIVLTDDGEFHQARFIKDAEIGEIVEYERIRTKKQIDLFRIFQLHSSSNHLISIFTVALVCVGMIYLFLFSNGEDKYAFVTIDMKSSIELVVDDHLQVKSIQPLNDEGTYVKSLLDVRNEDRHFKDVFTNIMNISAKTYYSELQPKNVLIGTTYEKAQLSMEDTIRTEVEQLLKDFYRDWNYAYVEIPKNIHFFAQDQKTSAFRIIAKDLIKGRPKILDEQFVNSSATEDMQAVLYAIHKPVEASKDEFRNEIEQIKGETADINSNKEYPEANDSKEFTKKEAQSNHESQTDDLPVSTNYKKKKKQSNNESVDYDFEYIYQEDK